jgi:hypothetical protein
MSFNKLPIEEIKIGMSATYTQTVTDADVKIFAGLSGDRNPVHMDEDYAKKSRFKKRIAHGMISASFFSALFGTKIPGEGCVYTRQSLNFKRPIYINDTVEAVVTVSGIDLEKRRVVFETICKVDGMVAIDGEAELYIPVEFSKILVNDKNELLKYKEQILELFLHSFGHEIDENLWNWAYMDNPNGNPIVSLYFDNNKLVGHYAVIPIKFTHNQKTIDAVLSMTTMVDASYRKYGIFVEQANNVYDKAAELGYKFVYGFPNKKSAPGFKKRLEWIIDDSMCVSSLSYDDLQQIKTKEHSSLISFDIEDEDNLYWRLNKPGCSYFRNNYSILKKFDDKVDIVFSGTNFSTLDRNGRYNLLLPIGLTIGNKEFDYIFGYKLFDSSLNGLDFKKDLIMSDIF